MNTNNTRRNLNKNLIFGENNVTGGATTVKSVYEMYGISSERSLFIRQLFRENLFKVLWYCIFLALTAVCVIIYPPCWLNAIEVVTCMVAIELIGRAKLAGQIVSCVECVLYAFISWRAGLFGEVIKSLGINLTLTIVALISWTKNIKRPNNNGNTLKIRELSGRGWALSGVLFVGVSVACYFLLNLIGTASLILSSITLGISIVYKILNARCYKESWLIDILRSCISLGLWLSVVIAGATSGALDLTGLPLIVMYLAILTNGIYSLMLWRAMYKKATVNGGKLFAMRPIKIKRVIKLRKRFKTLKWIKEIDVSKNS